MVDVDGERGGMLKLLVYDFGGGTLDCTLLEVEGDVFEVIFESQSNGLCDCSCFDGVTVWPRRFWQQRAIRALADRTLIRESCDSQHVNSTSSFPLLQVYGCV